MNISNPHIIEGSTIQVARHKIKGCTVNTDNQLNISSGYDDSAIKHRLDILESDVHDLKQEDVNIKWRLSRIEGNYVTKQEFNALDQKVTQIDSRVTKLETIPVGLDESTMDEILED